MQFRNFAEIYMTRNGNRSNTGAVNVLSMPGGRSSTLAHHYKTFSVSSDTELMQTYDTTDSASGSSQFIAEEPLEEKKTTTFTE